MLYFFTFISAQQYRIRLFGTDQFVAGDISKESLIHLVNLNDSTVFNFRSDKELGNKIYITVYSADSLAVKVDKDTKIVKLAAFERSNDHLFRFIPLEFNMRTFWLSNGSECLTWNEKKVLMECMPCEENNKFQAFQVFVLDEKEEDVYGKGESYLYNKKEILTENVIRSHEMENEGENLISTIFNALDRFDLCLDKKGVCNFKIDYLDAYYNAKGYSGYSYSSSESANLQSSSFVQ